MLMCQELSFNFVNFLLNEAKHDGAPISTHGIKTFQLIYRVFIAIPSTILLCFVYFKLFLMLYRIANYFVLWQAVTRCLIWQKLRVRELYMILRIWCDCIRAIQYPICFKFAIVLISLTYGILRDIAHGKCETINLT